MAIEFKTEQEKFWSGEFGDQYIERNCDESIIAANTALFSRILSRTDSVKSVIEFGANIGLNLIAIKRLLPNIDLSAIEINPKAVEELNKIDCVKTYPQSILEYEVDFQRDFVLTKGVLIHINPGMLPVAYDLMYRTSSRYICVIEYYNPTPVEVDYRGHRERLFKRDFAGELMDNYDDLRLLDYGFVYRRDNNFIYGDENWFLLEKQCAK